MLVRLTRRSFIRPRFRASWNLNSLLDHCSEIARTRRASVRELNQKMEKKTPTVNSAVASLVSPQIFKSFLCILPLPHIHPLSLLPSSGFHSITHFHSWIFSPFTSLSCLLSPSLIASLLFHIGFFLNIFPPLHSCHLCRSLCLCFFVFFSLPLWQPSRPPVATVTRQ